MIQLESYNMYRKSILSNKWKEVWKEVFFFFFICVCDEVWYVKMDNATKLFLLLLCVCIWVHIKLYVCVRTCAYLCVYVCFPYIYKMYFLFLYLFNCMHMYPLTKADHSICLEYIIKKRKRKKYIMLNTENQTIKLKLRQRGNIIFSWYKLNTWQD